ncbi:MAG: hypothetical protein QXU79_00195 [Candidatus Micrarchaeaceae archaeon]
MNTLSREELKKCGEKYLVVYHGKIATWPDDKHAYARALLVTREHVAKVEIESWVDGDRRYARVFGVPWPFEEDTKTWIGVRFVPEMPYSAVDIPVGVARRIAEILQLAHRDPDYALTFALLSLAYRLWWSVAVPQGEVSS